MSLLQLLQQPSLIAVTHEELRRAVQVLLQLPARRAGGRQYRPETRPACQSPSTVEQSQGDQQLREIPAQLREQPVVLAAVHKRHCAVLTTAAAWS